MKTFSIDFCISQEIYQKIERIFGERIQGAEILNKLGEAAFTEWLDWLDADQRYMTIPDLEARRVLIIYKEILVKEVPSKEHLCSVLYLVPSRGQYIAHSISYKYAYWWRKRLFEIALQDCENAFTKNDTCFVLVTDKACQEVIDPILDEVTSNNPGGPIAKFPVKRRNGKVHYEIGKLVFPSVKTKLKQALQGMVANQNGDVP